MHNVDPNFPGTWAVSVSGLGLLRMEWCMRDTQHAGAALQISTAQISRTVASPDPWLMGSVGTGHVGQEGDQKDSLPAGFLWGSTAPHTRLPSIPAWPWE